MTQKWKVRPILSLLWCQRVQCIIWLESDKENLIINISTLMILLGFLKFCGTRAWALTCSSGTSNKHSNMFCLIFEKSFKVISEIDKWTVQLTKDYYIPLKHQVGIKNTKCSYLCMLKNPYEIFNFIPIPVTTCIYIAIIFQMRHIDFFFFSNSLKVLLVEIDLNTSTDNS